MGQPTLEAQLKNAQAELKRLEDPATLAEAREKVKALQERMAKKAIREARSAALARARGPGEDELREAKVAGVLLVVGDALTKPAGHAHAMKALLTMGLSKAEAEHCIEMEVAMLTAVPAT